MVLVDGAGLPLVVNLMPASPHESPLVQRLFDFMFTEETPRRIIGEAYDSDVLDQKMDMDNVEVITLHRVDCKTRGFHQGWTRFQTIQASLDRRAHHQVDTELPPIV